jgi:hypothetical protein
LASISFTAPAGGFAFVLATGYCNGTGAADNFEVGLDTTATAIPCCGSTGAQYMYLNQGQMPFSVSNSFSAVPGSNVFYLNISQSWPAGQGATSCAGILSVFYSANALPP